LTTVSTGSSVAMGRARATYFYLLVVLSLFIALASFVRDRGSPLTNISFWFFSITFVIAVVSPRLGLLATAALLTISPSLHQQLNSVVGVALRAWAYPGVDCAIGFIAAWVVRGGLKDARSVLERFPGGTLLALHAWMTLSALVAVTHNLWQSASEFSLRGLISHAWLLRWITFQDDYFPIQDLYFYSLALAIVVGAYAVVAREGDRTVRELIGAVLFGAAANFVFAVWQQSTGKGWYAIGVAGIDVNALWPDIHSFGPFMAFALSLGLGLIVTRDLPVLTRALTVFASLAAAVGLYLSGSRSTLLIVALLLIIAASWAAFRLHGWRRAVALACAMALLTVMAWLGSRGYRGVSLSSFGAALEALDFNTALSHRPEIWGAALRMYLGFPFFGLGQGAFYRLSSIEQFSGSETLARLGGNGAHNYFLQSFVELGPVGGVLALLIAVPAFRLGRHNFRLISFYALLGIGVGNIYAHPLLVREMLMLAAIFGGVYVWEARTLAPDLWRPLSGAALRRASVVIGVLALVAGAEAAFSFSRYPFIYGQRCNEVRELARDGWTQGTLRVDVPSGASAVDVTLLADRRDLEERSVDITLAIVNQQAARKIYRVEIFDRENHGPRDVSLDIGSSITGPLSLEIRASRCYVPLNLGRGHDARHLGVRVQKIEFRPAAP